MEREYPPQAIVKALFNYRAGALFWSVTSGCRRVGPVGTAPNQHAAYSTVSFKYKDGPAHFAVHRLIWIYHNGAIPEGIKINHLNGDKYDNRIENLALITVSQAAARRTRTRRVKQGYRGVIAGKRAFTAVIYHDYQRVVVGRFGTAIEAARAYNVKARELWGEFANLNEGV